MSLVSTSQRKGVILGDQLDLFALISDSDGVQTFERMTQQLFVFEQFGRRQHQCGKTSFWFYTNIVSNDVFYIELLNELISKLAQV